MQKTDTSEPILTGVIVYVLLLSLDVSNLKNSKLKLSVVCLSLSVV